MKRPVPAAPVRAPLPAAPPRLHLWIAAALLALASFAAYSNSFRGPFVFDDLGTILGNPSLLRLWPLTDVLAGPPGGTTASGRPLVNLSLAINHAIGGTNPFGYHVFNFAVHLGAGLTLFGLLRRTLCTPPLRDRFGAQALPIAFTCAAVWMLHPLQTAAVTYVVQRAEAMAALFYLLTLYTFARVSDSPRPAVWRVCSVASCLAAMACKETAASAPLVVLLYDRTFLAGTFRAAWRRNAWLYVALAATWILLLTLVVSTSGRGGSVGDSDKITGWAYALTQCRAIWHYLRLAFWPTPLVFDYGTPLYTTPGAIAAPAFGLLLLLAATGLALRRRPVLGFSAATFLALLAPSSSVVPVVTQTMAEHRMYLPLALVVALAVLPAAAKFGRSALVVFLGLSGGLALLTHARNADYQDAIGLWEKTATHSPDPKRAYNNLGAALHIAGRSDEALAAFQLAIDLDPDYTSALVNLGRTELATGKIPEATRHFERALELDTSLAEAHHGLGFIYSATGRLEAALHHHRKAVELQPANADYRLKLAQVCFRANLLSHARDEFHATLRLAPDSAAAHAGLGTALAASGDKEGAARELNEALRLDPNDVDGHFNLGNVYAEQERFDDALRHYERALELRPDHAPARRHLELLREHLRTTR